ncbi:MAG: histidine kinase [Clostridiales bacterium]|nr:histidine kinase [Clostridiales bacterium]
MRGALSFIRTFRFRILAIAALCWLLPTLALGGYLGGGIIQSLRRQTESALLLSAAYAEADAVTELERIVALAKSVTYDEVFSAASAAYLSGEYRYQDFFRTCRIYVDRKFAREQAFTFAAFYLIDQPGRVISTTPTTASSERVTRFVQGAQAAALRLGETLDTRCRFLSVGGETYLVRNLLNRKLERFGMLVIGIDTRRVLAPLLDGAAWGGIDIQLDDFRLGRALPAEAAIGLSESPGELLVDGRVAKRDYTLIYRAHVDKRVAYRQVDQFYRLMRLLAALLLPLEALIMVFVQRRLTRPLSQLADASARIERGELGVTVDIDTADEVGQLARGYNAMSLKIRHLIEKAFEEELILRDARIEALQSRINPHFLNNALELINWQARIEGSEAISRMIEAMSTLINASLDRESRRVVPLREELQVADAYFYFLDQRFGDRLAVARDVDPSLLDAPVPRLAIQTLLENAVEHGIAPVGGGAIRLSASARDGLLLIDVTNTGALSAEDQSRIRRLLDDDGRGVEGKLSERLGIRNIDRRARLIYGERASLMLTPDAGGTLARLSLPMDNVNFQREVDKPKQQSASAANDRHAAQGL